MLISGHFFPFFFISICLVSLSAGLASFASEPARTVLVMIPRIRAVAMVVMVISPNVRDNPPIPAIRITDAVKRFLLIPRSTFWSILRPDTEINPYREIHTPPITQEGMESISATRGVKNENIIHPNAANRMVMLEAFPVMATHAMDSP